MIYTILIRSSEPVAAQKEREGELTRTVPASLTFSCWQMQNTLLTQLVLFSFSFFI
jgi:hypothetical protein